MNKRRYKIDEIKKIENIKIGSVVELCEISEMLQCFYSLNRDRNMEFANGTACFYRCFWELVSCCKKINGLGYVAGCLGATFDTVDSFKRFIREKQECNIKRLRYSEIELILRCFIDLIINGDLRLSVESYFLIERGIREIVEEYNYYTVINWYR